MLYLWEIPNEYPEALIGEYDRQHGPDRFTFKLGQPLDPLPSLPLRFRFQANSSTLRTWHDLGNNAMVPLVSKTVGDLLISRCPQDLQLLTTRLECFDTEIADYSLVIVTNKIRGLDHFRSEIALIRGTHSIMKVTNPIYFGSCLGPHCMARDEEYLSNLLVGNELFRSLSRLRSLGLHPVETVGRKGAERGGRKGIRNQ